MSKLFYFLGGVLAGGLGLALAEHLGFGRGAEREELTEISSGSLDEDFFEDPDEAGAKSLYAETTMKADVTDASVI